MKEAITPEGSYREFIESLARSCCSGEDASLVREYGELFLSTQRGSEDSSGRRIEILEYFLRKHKLTPVLSAMPYAMVLSMQTADLVYIARTEATRYCVEPSPLSLQPYKIDPFQPYRMAPSRLTQFSTN